MKKLIAFDCFGVIFSEIAPYLFAKRIKNEAEAQMMKDEFFVPADSGKMSVSEVIHKMADYFHEDYESLKAEWDSYAVLDVKMKEYIEMLSHRDDIDLILISNAPEGLLEELFPKYDLEKYFKKLFISWKYGGVKPSLDFYRYCLDNLDEEYEVKYMIDDNINNVKHLDSIGIKGIRYTSLAKLKEELGIW